ncbi:MAG: 30S ribosome-binding factor RbfA [Candidatus Omnitrophota bacterium]
MIDRIDRLQETIKRVLSSIIVSEISDPRVRDVVILRVELTGDLKFAKVFYRVGDNVKDEEKEIKRGLKSASSFIRRELAKAVSMRYIPQILFKVDLDEERRNVIDDILKKIELEKNLKKNKKRGMNG